MQNVERMNGAPANTVYADDRIQVKHVMILVSGGLAGLIAAYLFNLIHFDFSAELNKARSLGIVSLTTIRGYPKLRDAVAYASLLGFPVVFSLVPWYLWAKNKKQLLASLFDGGGGQPFLKDRGWVISLALVVLFYAYASFNINQFYVPAWNRNVGAWLLLGEDGENLAWVQSIFSGGVYGKDFFCLYGPMLIYPLAAFLKIFGASVAVEHYYRYVLDLIAYGIVVFFLYKTLRSKATFVVFSVAYVLVYPVFTTPSVNFTYLRFILGVLPLLLLFLFLQNGKRSLLVLAGVVIGQSLLFSQEAGVASCIAVLGALLARAWCGREWRLFFLQCLIIAGACLLSVAPMVFYLSAKGGFHFFLDSLYGFPKLSSLGYGGIPAPSLDNFLVNPGRYFFYFGVIFFYGFAAVYLLPLLILRKLDRHDLLSFSLLLFGAVLYVVAVRRYSQESIHKVFHPALLLLFLFFDAALNGARMQKGISKILHAVLLLMLTIFTLALATQSSFLRGMLDAAKARLDPEYKLSRVALGVAVPSLTRGGVYYDEITAASLVTIQDFLERNTRPGEYVYFFPNEAAYYFLFDRNNPTRYAISYFAITTDQRRDLVAELEQKKPTYIVYSKSTWRVDNIQEDIQVPEVVQYITHMYRIETDTEYVQIWTRKHA
jgi:hypothetical protein